MPSTVEQRREPPPARRWFAYEGRTRPGRRGPADPGAGRSWRRPAVLVPIAVLSVAAALRLWGLGSPTSTVWDEGYYVHDAEAYLGGALNLSPLPRPAMAISGEVTWVHPPLGKVLIAMGDGPTGGAPWGYRMPSAVAGITGVFLLYLLALELWGSVWWAGLASFLLAVDGLHVVQSRLAMLDIFLATFVTAGVLFLVRDRRRAQDRRDGPGGVLDRWFGSSDRFWAGAMFSCAVAVKWSGLFALALGVALCGWWIARAPDFADRPRARRARTMLAAFLAIPLGVYVLGYTQAFVQHGMHAFGFLTLQRDMLLAQLHLHRVNTAMSGPASWPLLLHPIQYQPNGQPNAPHQIWALGNPVLWWGFLLMLPFLIARLVRTRDWRIGWPLGFAAAMYLPWFAFSRSEYLFYMLPVVPFMCLSAAAAMRELSPRVRRPAAVAFAATSSVVTAVYLPILLWLPVSTAYLNHIRLLPRWP